jgi:TRAP-type C4-dicarboxylate transport system permease small subunit
VTLDGTDMSGMDAFPAVLIALIPILFAFLIIWGASLFDPEEHPALRIFSHILSWVFVFGSLWIGTMVLLKFYNWTAATDAVGTFGLILGVLVFALSAYWIVYVFYKIVEAFKEKKESRLNA